jgi:acyl-CoA thioesterase-1
MPGTTPSTMQRLFYLLAISLLLSACTESTSRLPSLDSNSTILAFGDSLTRGIGAAEEQSYPAVLSRLSGRTVVNAGISGEVSAQGLQRLPALLDRLRPDLLLLCHGGNDMLRRFSTDITRNNIEAMISLAAERGIPVLLIGVPKPGLMFLRPATFYAEIAEHYDLVYEGDIIAEVESDNSLKSDQIHPNADGYGQIAAALHRLLQESGAL